MQDSKRSLKSKADRNSCMVQDDELAHKPSKQLRERLDELCESTPQVPPEENRIQLQRNQSEMIGMVPRSEIVGLRSNFEAPYYRDERAFNMQVKRTFAEYINRLIPFLYNSIDPDKFDIKTEVDKIMKESNQILLESILEDNLSGPDPSPRAYPILPPNPPIPEINPIPPNSLPKSNVPNLISSSIRTYQAMSQIQECTDNRSQIYGLIRDSENTGMDRGSRLNQERKAYFDVPEFKRGIKKDKMKFAKIKFTKKDYDISSINY